MTLIAILDDYQNVALSMADWSFVSKQATITTFSKPFADIDEAAEQLEPYDIVCLMRERTPFPGELIERLPKLRFIVLTGKRSQTLDFATAHKRGIVISHTNPGPAPHATPELAWALILAAARHVPKADLAMRQGQWLDGVQPGIILHGKTLGVLGLGNVGSRVAAIAKAFGMDVIAWSQNLTRERTEEAGVMLADSKEDLLERSDVVTLHLVLSDRTRGIIGEAEFDRMKPSALLINTSRGPLVDEDALVEALGARKIAGAGIDVYDAEPFAADHPLRKLENVVLTPHIGYVTEEIYQTYYGETVEAIAAFLNSAPIRVIEHPQ